MTKELKSIFSSVFQRAEEQVSVKGVVTHAPVCRSASRHWQEQLSVAPFCFLSTWTDWVVVSALGSFGSPLTCCLRCGYAAVALAAVAPSCCPHKQPSEGAWWAQVGPVSSLSAGCSDIRGLFRTCWAWWPPQQTRSAFAERQLPWTAHLVRGVIKNLISPFSLGASLPVSSLSCPMSPQLLPNIQVF